MIIEIGKIFRHDNDSILGVDIPGVGIVRAIEDLDVSAFQLIVLDRKDLIKLKEEIEKELNYVK